MSGALDYLAAAIAYRFFGEAERFQFPSGTDEMLDNIRSYYSIDLTKAQLQQALVYLNNAGFISFEHDKYAGALLSADQREIDGLYRQYSSDRDRPAFRPISENAREFYDAVFKNVDFWTDLAGEPPSANMSDFNHEVAGVPASDRMVTVLHNSIEGREIVSSLDSVIQDLQVNNHVADVAGEDRSRLLAEAKASKELLAGESVRLSTMMQLLWKFFKELSVKFKEKATDWGVDRAIALLDKLLDMVK